MSIENMSERFVMMQAPRTAIGYFPNGTLFLLQVRSRSRYRNTVAIAPCARSAHLPAFFSSFSCRLACVLPSLHVPSLLARAHARTQIDGEEDIAVGVNLYELEDILMDLGVLSAVNLDGGGSSETVVNGTVVSRPTCDDMWLICERQVTTITCLMR